MSTAVTDASEYSVVVPVYNEQGCLEELGSRLGETLDGLSARWEVIFVDDGSSDGSYDEMTAIATRDPRFKILRLSRNFGHQNAITAGLDAASGDAVVIMDADLQHPPEIIPQLAARWREGYDVVYAIRSDRAGEPWTKRVTARVFYGSLGRVADIEVPADAGDFRLVDRRALDAFRSLRETNRYVRGMFSWIGFAQIGVEYPYEERRSGESKYSLRKMAALGSDALTSFSTAPLRVALHVGFVVAALSLLAATTAVVAKIAGIFTVPGWTSLVFVTSLLGGVQLLVLGVVGVYLGRIYEEVKNRPLYIVRDAQGFDERAVPPPRDVGAVRQGLVTYDR
ncbi:MAG TPA: glycosyltransferase family 2 protein [Gaiellaceae bacterium]|nr:glycosyltransferase family 2 protein [Gaiellaceae bacterium]